MADPRFLLHGVTGTAKLDGAATGAPGYLAHYLSSWRAMTMRWIWLVPS
jgi:hypothetical protein